MSMYKFLVLLSFLIACKSDPATTKPRIARQWQFLTLELNDTVVQLTRDVNSFTVAHFVKGEQQYAIGNEEADSLFSWANQLVLFQEPLSEFCTDYKESMRVRIRYNTQLYKEASFRSVCDWRGIAPPARQMDALLKKLMKVK